MLITTQCKIEIESVLRELLIPEAPHCVRPIKRLIYFNS